MALTQISTGGVKDDAVTAGKIPANAVGSSEIADDAVDQGAIADEAVDEARLQISNAGTNGQFLQKSSGTGGLTWATVTVPDADKIEEGNTSVETVDTGSDGHVKITTEGTERVRVTNDGKVGINNNNPTVKLAVDGGTTNDATTVQIKNDSTSAYATTDGGLNTSLSLFSDGTNSNQGVGVQLYLQKSGETGAISEIGATRESSGNSNLVFRTRISSSGVNERMRISSAGAIGVNGANYGSSGQVLTSGGASAAPSWADAGGGAFSDFDAWDLGGGPYNMIPQAWRWDDDILGQNVSDKESPLYRVSNLTPVGNGMSQTNGVFTFPATGMWKIDLFLVTQFQTSGGGELEVWFDRSTDSGSSYSNIVASKIKPDDQYIKFNRSFMSYFNCTSTSTNRFRIRMKNQNPYQMQLVDNTSITFMKVA